MATVSAGATPRSADRTIGTILVDSGRLSADDVESILLHQQQNELRFGEAAISLGLVGEADVLFALSLQFDYPYLSGPARPVSDEVVMAYRPFGVEGEKMRSLRSQLQLRWFGQGGSRTALAITGTRRGEGRSYMAANLAVTFAQARMRTLLIDGNLRNPRQHELFKIDNQGGLSNLLVGRMKDKVVQFVTGIPGLAILPAGPIPPNPEELLGRASIDRIIDQSISTFEVVLIDTPSLTVGADATLLARFAGAALAVARTNHTRMTDFHEMLEHLQEVNVAVVGSVLVDVPYVPKRILPRIKPVFTAGKV